MAEAASKLTPEAETYFKNLPADEYPAMLIEAYPRIANQIVALRNNKPDLAKYFESLLADERGNRQGFAFRILVEIQTLFDVMVGIPGGFANTNWMLQEQLKKK
jgi:hypothetical protein